MSEVNEAEMTRAVGELGTVLGVWAHPDDECYLMAGLTVLARRSGNRVACVTATRGELGTPDPQAWPPERLGRLREWELKAALSILDMSEHHWLGYPDGGCAGIDSSRGIEAIGQIIGVVAPDTIVTFGRDGMTGHSDHLTVCEWATAARERYAPGARLLYATTTPEAERHFSDQLAGSNVYEPGYPITTAKDDLALRLELDGGLLDQKFASLRAQSSQTSIFVQAIGEATYRDLLREEAFVDADM